MTDHNARQTGLTSILGPDEDGLPIERYSHRSFGMAPHPNGTYVRYSEVERRLAAHSADARNGEGVTLKDYEEAFADHQRMVRELDVLLNGDDAAKQASLCDIVAQVHKEGIRSEGVSLNEKQQKDLHSHMMAVACRTWDETPSTSIKAHLRAVVKAIAAEPKIRAALLAAPDAPAPKCTRCEYIGKCDCEPAPAPAAQAGDDAPERTKADWLAIAPTTWDDEYRDLWASLQVSQERVMQYRRRWKAARQHQSGEAGSDARDVLRTDSGNACFVWRKFIDDSGQHGINCAVFRNESSHRSSHLIRQADAIADCLWPDSRHYTYVNPEKVASKNPGFCFLAAGWKRCGRTKGGLMILERVASAAEIGRKKGEGE